MKGFYEEKQLSSEDNIDILELNYENNSFRQRETKNIKLGENISINSEIKKISNHIFKTEIIQKSVEYKMPIEKNKNLFSLSVRKKSNPIEQKYKIPDKKMYPILCFLYATPNVNFVEENNSYLFDLKEIKKLKSLQITKNTSSQTNISTSKESVSTNKLNFSKSIISAPSLDNSFSNINLNNMSFSGFSFENNNFKNIQLLKRHVDDNLCNKKRKREDEKIKVKKKNKIKNEFNDEPQLNLDMKNNNYENINVKINNINNSIDNLTNNKIIV